MNVRFKVNSRRMAPTLVVLLSLACSAYATPPSTNGNGPFVIDFPAGMACSFALRLESPGTKTLTRTFYDKDGNVVRLLFAGLGQDLLFTNVDTGAQYATRANGSSQKVTPHADGSVTIVGTGHIVQFQFPGDTPPGPSTTLYVGRVVVENDASGVTGSVDHRGAKPTDICAALS